MNSAPGKSPSFWRVAVVAGAGALFASAMTPAHAAAIPAKPVPAKKKDSARQQQQQSRGGASASPLSLQWMMGASLRP
jgi:hypothetical protein